MTAVHRKLLKGLGALFILGLVASLPIAFIGYLAVVEHERRAEIVRHGQAAAATVTKSNWATRGCVFEYRFTFNETEFEGGVGGCPLAATHSVGSIVTVRFDADQPEHSVAEGADLWPGWAIAPILLSLPLLGLASVFAYAIVANAAGSKRRRPNS